MANEWSNANEVIALTVAEAAKVTIQAMAAARAEGTQNAGPRLGRPIMKQLTFNWKAEDKYNVLKNFSLEVNSIFISYSIPQAEQLAIIIKWLGRKGLQYLETLTETEQEKCNTLEGLFATLNNKFKPKYNETIKSLQF